MKFLLTLLFIAVLAVTGAVGFAYSGLYDVRASVPHGGFTTWLLATTSRASIARHAKDIEVPDLGDPALASAGINDYDAMCTGCHGAPGRRPEAMGRGLNPRAPDLSKSAARLSPAELFWVTKHGIKMTGMPAWGATHGDDMLWPVVAFMTTLPQLDGAAYKAQLASASGQGHHMPGEDAGPHEHGDSGQMPMGTDHDDSQPTRPTVPPGHDNSDGHHDNDGEPDAPDDDDEHDHDH